MSPVELQKALQAVEPAAVLVAPAVLDRMIRQTLKIPRWMWTVPHHRTWNVDRQFLFRFVEQEDLLVRPDQLLPSTVLLLERPDGYEGRESNAELLLTYWRLLFHASVDQELANQTMDGKWALTEVQQRIDRLGTTVFDEIRAVLQQENCLPPKTDARAVYLEFVAVFLELYYFARNFLESFFPGIPDIEAVKKDLDRDIDGAAIYMRTRLPGAPEPGLVETSSPHEAHEYFYELVRESDDAEKAGNLVRAAIQRSRAARVAPAAQAYDTRQQAVALLELLLARLQPALEIPADELPEWSKHLPELLDKADQGRRPAEAYLLYDLQKVCLDFEREIYTLDLVEWLLSGGKKPVRRPLTSQRLVRVTRHMRSAAQRLTMVRLSELDRKHFAGLLAAAQARCEHRVRQRFRPVLTSALEDVGLAPRNPGERTAFLKLTDELLDQTLVYGFLTFSDLRDGLSRNQLKLPDLTDPQDFIRGDPLLRLDRRLATLLDGVYRRGEFYLRWLERFTALNFGTKLGRLLTKFVTVPFLGAFLLVEVINHFILHPLGVDHFPVYFYVPVWGLLGAFLLGLLHSKEVRRRAAGAGRAAWRPIKIAVVQGPLWVVQNESLRGITSSWTFQLCYWYLFKPLVLCTLLWLLVPETFSTWVQIALAFLAANFLINSRPGHAAWETIGHGLKRFFHLLRGGLIPELIYLVVEVFKHFLHTMEAVLFKVDEWLRFRGGDNRMAMVIRVILGVIWFPISYLARFNMVVLIEPGLNPVKFPVCSIATKMLLPVLPVIHTWLVGIFSPVFPEVVTYAVATWITFWLPDVFGFLFWEMKENWDLYEANKGLVPEPAIIGKHGETMRRLLQPGFHSGTIPKLFAKLRDAERKAHETGNFTKVRALRTAFEKVEEAVRQFVMREFLVLLEHDPTWKDKSLSVGAVRLATNQVQVELVHKNHPDQPLVLKFENQEGKMTAGSLPAHWLAELPLVQEQALRQALGVLYQLAGVEPEPTETPDNLNGAVIHRFALVPANGEMNANGERNANGNGTSH